MLLRVADALQRVIADPLAVASKDLLFLGIFESFLSLLLIKEEVDVIGLNVGVSLAFWHLQGHDAAELDVLGDCRMLNVDIELFLILELLVVSHLIEDLVEVEASLNQLGKLLLQVDHYLIDVSESHLLNLFPALDLVLSASLVGPVLRDLVHVTSLLLIQDPSCLVFDLFLLLLELLIDLPLAVNLTDLCAHLPLSVHHGFIQLRTIVIKHLLALDRLYFALLVVLALNLEHELCVLELSLLQ